MGVKIILIGIDTKVIGRSKREIFEELVSFEILLNKKFIFKFFIPILHKTFPISASCSPIRFTFNYGKKNKETNRKV
jgi:hypothetical protein